MANGRVWFHLKKKSDFLKLVSINS
jgi:hypothetical protein